MAFDRVALEALAESIGDGAPIEWGAIEAQAGDDQRAVIRQLRVLDGLAHLHRTLPVVSGDTPSAPMPARSLSAPAIGAWGRLSLLERLGGGTSGDVYRAWDGQLERDVALKLLRSDAPDPSRLVAEGRRLARLHHENVVTVHGVDTHDGRVGLWMPLVRGVTLEEVVTTKGPFSAREAAVVGIDLCRALAAIHAAGLVHRDVKAQNVVREDGGRIVLMDLGTGRDVARGENTAGLAGTPLYLAPEIFAGAPASVQSDVYSLGVLLYHLVTGEYPASPATFEALEQAHARRALVPLRDRRPDLPPAFVAAIERALDPDLSRRYKSTGEFEAALVRTLEAPPARGRRAIVWTALGLVAVALVLVGVAASLWRSANPPPAAAAPIHTIAVLPLRNDSADAAQDYFADGMTDEIINWLGRLPGISVISRTSSMQFKGLQFQGASITLPDIARTLQADAIVEGSIMLTPGVNPGSRKVRINARLIAAGTDAQIWSQTFESVATDVLALEGEVARAIANGVRLQLSPVQQNAISGARQRQPDFEAFNLYLQGRAAWSVRTRDSLERSVALFEQAIAQDPGYAAPHAGLADAYHLLEMYGWMRSADAVAKAADEAARAIALDDTLADAHVSMGQVHDSRFEWAAAETSFRRAIQLNPGLAVAHHWYGLLLSKRGDFAEATAEVERARTLDPLSPVPPTLLATFQYEQGNRDEAIARLERVVADQPRYQRAHFILAQVYAKAGRYDQARAEADRSAAPGTETAELRGLIGCILAASGRQAEARTIADELITRHRDARDSSAAVAAATVYATLGDIEQAFEWLEQARTERDPTLSFLRVDPWFEPLRADPRFDRLLARLGLTG